MREKGKIKISRLFLGNSNAYVAVSGDEAMVVDAGLGQRSEIILSEIQKLGGDSCRLKYIGITHAHYDHVGSVAGLKRVFPEAEIVAQDYEAANLSAGRSPVPAGTMWFSRPVSWLGCMIFRHCIHFKGFCADVTFSDHYHTNLGGHEVEFFHTPGHTEGSMCVRIGDEAVFVGDTVFHVLPQCYYPPFADDERLLQKSWKRVLAGNARFVYPGHGRPFPLARLAAVMPSLFVQEG